VCRYNIRPAVKVTIRGLVIEVPWRKRHLTCAQAILEAMETFKTQHPHFVFRFPFLPACSFAELPCLSGMAWYGRHTFVDEVLKDADGSPLLEVRTASARHPNAIPSDAFAYARLLVKQPLKPRWASPRGVDPYYMRTDNWLETSIAAHQNGECRWSRKRRVLELEALLAHDEYDDPFEGEYTDDDAWGARRAQHVQLLQAVQAYEDGESGVRELFDNKKEGPLEGPIGRTHVRLPPSRDTEAERASILRNGRERLLHELALRRRVLFLIRQVLFLVRAAHPGDRRTREEGERRAGHVRAQLVGEIVHSLRERRVLPGMQRQLPMILVPRTRRAGE
jgi:hypothetical protein